MRRLGAWFRRRILGRVTISTLYPHGISVGDGSTIYGAANTNHNGPHVVTRVVDSPTFEIRPLGRKNYWPAMRDLSKMLACFAVSMYLVVQASHFAADGKPVAACIVGVFVFGLYVYMAAASARAEREATKK